MPLARVFWHLVDMIERDQGSSECDTGGMILGMGGEAGPAHCDGFTVPPGAPELFGELAESD